MKAIAAVAAIYAGPIKHVTSAYVLVLQVLLTATEHAKTCRPMQTTVEHVGTHA